jgi:hypothetical protein
VPLRHEPGFENRIGNIALFRELSTSPGAKSGAGRGRPKDFVVIVILSLMPKRGAFIFLVVSIRA